MYPLERERESERGCVRVYVCVRERECVCVYECALMQHSVAAIDTAQRSKIVCLSQLVISTLV
jgi:hypothetical protein